MCRNAQMCDSAQQDLRLHARITRNHTLRVIRMVTQGNTAEIAHSLPAAQVLRLLEVDVDIGLTPTIAAERLTQYGPNALRKTPPAPAWRSPASSANWSF